MQRICNQCNRTLPRAAFTTSQWAKGAALCRCIGCVHGHPEDNPDSVPSDSACYIYLCPFISPWAFLHDNETLSQIFGIGSRRKVFKAVYSGYEQCVGKFLKTGMFQDHGLFHSDMKTARKAVEILNLFNQLKIIDRTIRFTVPQFWTFQTTCKEFRWVDGLMEQYLGGFRKFNSNTGWTCEPGSEWGEMLQALSHFSYHITGGNYVLCNLKGGYRGPNFQLSSPTIMSRTKEYGVADLGGNGIASFFYQHTCTRYCRPEWNRPAAPEQHFKRRRRTIWRTRCRRHILPRSNGADTLAQAERSTRAETSTQTETSTQAETTEVVKREEKEKGKHSGCFWCGKAKH
ncbi:alpha-protein kinase 1 [Echria macrotheca]|uniref:Alpha-protein kinase 1 n=1 Tax=Echria macrotheca TaxID=438768 RepID=A0AAJ0BB67_9PEZI|nr:alpha-protein kinase 1 [Echria macrotheca]